MVKIGPVALEKMKAHDARRRTHDDGLQPIAIVDLSDSGDQKNSFVIIFNVHLKQSKSLLKVKTGLKGDLKLKLIFHLDFKTTLIVLNTIEYFFFL